MDEMTQGNEEQLKLVSPSRREKKINERNEKDDDDDNKIERQ